MDIELAVVFLCQYMGQVFTAEAFVSDLVTFLLLHDQFFEVFEAAPKLEAPLLYILIGKGADILI